jgi:ankyrin repeat protein
MATKVSSEIPTRTHGKIKGFFKSKDPEGVNKVVKEIGTTILKDVFLSEELKSIRKNIKESQDVVGTGYGDALIHAFAWRGRTTVVEFLLNKGADVNAKGSYNGMTPLLCAVHNGHEDTVRMLLERGTQIEGSSDDGSTALIEAAVQNHEGIVKLLLAKGAQKEATKRGGHTALHLAAASAYVKVVQPLLDAGANIDTMDNTGTTPLMLAAIHNKYWMVKLLLINGANVGAKDKGGWTALELHQNKRTAKMTSMAHAHDLRNTPIAKLLKDEMERTKRLREDMNPGTQ